MHLARRVDVGPWHLTNDRLLEYWDEHREAWARETKRSRRTTLRRFYGWAIGEGLTDTNPADGLPRVKPDHPKVRAIPDDVFDDAIARADERERLMLRLARDAGLRRGEIAVVHTDDVFQDLTGWSLDVHGKGGRERTVPLTRRLALELRAQPAGWVFPGDDGGHLSPRWVGKLINRLLPPPWTIHKIRTRAITTVFVTSGRNIRVAQEFAGHASIGTTKVYIEVLDTELRNAIEAAAS